MKAAASNNHAGSPCNHSSKSPAKGQPWPPLGAVRVVRCLLYSAFGSTFSHLYFPTNNEEAQPSTAMTTTTTMPMTSVGM